MIVNTSEACTPCSPFSSFLSFGSSFCSFFLEATCLLFFSFILRLMYFLVVFERLFYNVSKFLFLFQRFFYKLIYFLISLRNLNNWQIFFWNRVLTLESSCFSFSFLSSNSFSSLLSNLSSFSSIFLSSSFLAPKQKWYIHFPQQVYYLLHLLSLQVIRTSRQCFCYFKYFCQSISCLL